MKICELRDAYINKQIAKRLYWMLAREKIAILKEIQEMIATNSSIKKIEIEKTE